MTSTLQRTEAVVDDKHLQLYLMQLDKKAKKLN
jgi:hypothetical protein